MIRNLKVPRVKSIDGIRAILCVMIALFHFGQAFSLGAIFEGAWFAVEIFFILSGFLLIAGAESKGELFSVRDAMQSRLHRMYPAYIVGTLALVMVYAITWFKGDIFLWIYSDQSHLKLLLFELLCLQTTGISGLQYVNGPAWYVSSLLIVTFLLAYFYAKKKKSIFPVVTCVSVLLYGLMCVVCPSMPSAGFFLNTGIPVPLMRALAGMCLGAVLYWVYNCDKAIIIYNKIKHPEMWTSLSFVIVLGTLLFASYSRWFFLLLLPCSILILFSFWGSKNYFDKLLESRCVQFLGKMSFSFYIMQSFSQNVVQIYATRYTENVWLLNLIYILLNTFVGYIVYILVEVRFVRWVKHGHHKL